MGNYARWSVTVIKLVRKEILTPPLLLGTILSVVKGQVWPSYVTLSSEGGNQHVKNGRS